MVSLEKRSDFLLRIGETPKLAAFNNLLLNRTIAPFQNQELNETEIIYFEIISAIQTNNRLRFETYYNKKNKSNPSKESPSPFVNDDFFIFSLIVGITKFNLDKGWIKNIISIRKRDAITVTLENILNENYFSKDNVPEIILMFFQLDKLNLISNDLLNEALKRILDNTSLFEGKSDFQILCTVRAYDLIILLKDAPGGGEIQLLREFNSAFLKRIKILSWLIQTALIITILYGAIELISINPEAKIFFDKIGSVLKILGLVGLSQIGNVFPIVKNKLYELLLRIFGYPRPLLSKLPKNEAK